MIDLPILKHNGQRIFTTQQLAEIYETEVNNIQNNEYYLIVNGAKIIFDEEIRESKHKW